MLKNSKLYLGLSVFVLSIASNAALSTESQKYLSGRFQIETDAVTAETLQRDRPSLDKYLKYFNGTTSTAKNFVDAMAKNPNLDVKKVGAVMIVSAIKAKDGGLGGLDDARANAAVELALDHASSKDIIAWGQDYVIAFNELIQIKSKPTKEQIKAVHYLLTSNKNPAQPLLGREKLTSVHFDVIAELTDPTSSYYNSKPLQAERITKAAVEALSDAFVMVSKGDLKVDAYRELMWAIRGGYAGKPAGSVPSHVAIIFNTIDFNERNEDDKKLLLDHPELKNKKIYVFDNLWQVSGNAQFKASKYVLNGKFIVLPNTLSKNSSQLKMEKLKVGSFVVFDDLLEDNQVKHTDKDPQGNDIEVKSVIFDHADHHK